MSDSLESLSQTFSTLGLSKFTVTCSMLNELIERLHSENIDAINLDKMIVMLRDIDLFQNTNKENKYKSPSASGKATNSEMNDSISSGIPSPTQSIGSPNLEFKFKTPSKTFNFPETKSLDAKLAPFNFKPASNNSNTLEDAATIDLSKLTLGEDKSSGESYMPGPFSSPPRMNSNTTSKKSAKAIPAQMQPLHELTMKASSISKTTVKEKTNETLSSFFTMDSAHAIDPETQTKLTNEKVNSLPARDFHSTESDTNQLPPPPPPPPPPILPTPKFVSGLESTSNNKKGGKKAAKGITKTYITRQSKTIQKNGEIVDFGSVPLPIPPVEEVQQSLKKMSVASEMQSESNSKTDNSAGPLSPCCPMEEDPVMANVPPVATAGPPTTAGLACPVIDLTQDDESMSFTSSNNVQNMDANSNTSNANPFAHSDRSEEGCSRGMTSVAGTDAESFLPLDREPVVFNLGSNGGSTASFGTASQISSTKKKPWQKRNGTSRGGNNGHSSSVSSTPSGSPEGKAATATLAEDEGTAPKVPPGADSGFSGTAKGIFDTLFSVRTSLPKSNTDSASSDPVNDIRDWFKSQTSQSDIQFPKPPETAAGRTGMAPGYAKSVELAENFRRQGKDAYASEEYSRALDAFNKALDAAPENWVSLVSVFGNRAATLMMLERYVEAVADCEEALRVDPYINRLQGRRGRALLRLGHLSLADDAFTRLLASSLSGSKPDDADNAADAQLGSKHVQSARSLLSSLADRKTQLDGTLMLSYADELLQFCPQMRLAQAYRARALCLLQRWTEAKAFMERMSCLVHESIQSLHVHRSASLPAPKLSDLEWVEIGGGHVRMNVAASVQALLFMGPDMAEFYIQSLKNSDLVRNCSGDVMDMVTSVLLSTSSRVGSSVSWHWVVEEEMKTRAMAEAKVDADRYFRLKDYENAYLKYSDAMKADPDALRLNAILYSNRAATAMNLGRHMDAVSDCLQSISRDAGYSRAYLRRARAYRALGNVEASASDYRHYLSMSPRLSDYAEIEIEMMAMIQEDNQRNREKFKSQFKSSEWQRTSCPDFDAKSAQSSTWGSDRSDKDPYESSKPAPMFSRQRTDGAGFNRRTSSGAAGSGSRPYAWDSWDKETNFKYDEFNSRREKKAPETSPRKSATGKPVASDDNCNRRTSTGGTTSAGTTFGSEKEKMRNNDVLRAADVGSKSHYELLGVDERVNDRDLKMAYRRLALRYHPDKNKDEDAADVFKAITGAYSVLSDKTTRRSYDQSRLLERMCNNRYSRR